MSLPSRKSLKYDRQFDSNSEIRNIMPGLSPAQQQRALYYRENTIPPQTQDEEIAEYHNEFLNQISMNRREKSKCCSKQKCLSLCKKFITFLISRVGLMIAMVGYILAGGLIFEALEAPDEREAMKNGAAALQSMVTKIYQQVKINTTRVKDPSFYYFLRYEIGNYRNLLTTGTQSGTLVSSAEPQWDFFGSVFYCVTLVSTIGYGHITCKTSIGKFFTIIYSSIGVPLMMLFLANTGSSSATLFKFIYLRLHSVCRKYKMRKLAADPSSYNYSYNYVNDNYEKQPMEMYDSKYPYSLASMMKRSEETAENEDLSPKDSQAPDLAGSWADPPGSVPRYKAGRGSTDSRSVCVSIGIRDVDIPRDMVEKFAIVSSDVYVDGVRKKKSIMKKTKDSRKSPDKSESNSKEQKRPAELKIESEAKSSPTITVANIKPKLRPPNEDTGVSSMTTTTTVRKNSFSSTSLSETHGVDKTKLIDALKRIDDLIVPNRALSKDRINSPAEAGRNSKCVSNRFLFDEFDSEDDGFIDERQSIHFYTDYDDYEGDDFDYDFVNEVNYDVEIEDDAINKLIRNNQLIENILKANNLNKINRKRRSRKRLRNARPEVVQGATSDTRLAKGLNERLQERAAAKAFDKNDQDEKQAPAAATAEEAENKPKKKQASFKSTRFDLNNEATLGAKNNDEHASTTPIYVRNGSPVVDESAMERKFNTLASPNTIAPGAEASNSLQSSLKRTPTQPEKSALANTSDKINNINTNYYSSPNICNYSNSSRRGSIAGEKKYSSLKSKRSVKYKPNTSGMICVGGGKFGPTQYYTKKQLSLLYFQYQQERQDKIGVPMMTSLIILPLYLVAGMIIFSNFENWSKLDALYFCFVTLTTIGFGDIMPGSTLLNKHGNRNNLYISALYIFIGLILIAMCIHLMKKQFKIKIKNLARRVGLSYC